MGKTETISPKLRNETRMPTLPTPIQQVLEFQIRAIKQEEVKGLQIGKEIVTLSRFCRLHDPRPQRQKNIPPKNS
jgi:hypothetical protein